VAAEIRNSADGATARHREALVARMEDAVAAYERARFPEAARLARQVADEVPMVGAVRELAGLAAYRSGRWRDGVRHLTVLSSMTDSVEHVPALMDCHRALGQSRRVSELWSELRHRSPGPEVLAEARIVAAGSLADRGDLLGAIEVLATAGAAKSLRNPADRHLRQWYALGDLYERAGDLPRARELFSRVMRAEPDAYDVADRLEGLGPARPRRVRPRTRPKARDGGEVQQGGREAQAPDGGEPQAPDGGEPQAPDGGEPHVAQPGSMTPSGSA
jgi:tetratricopeptide (TPR) repeat protein